MGWREEYWVGYGMSRETANHLVAVVFDVLGFRIVPGEYREVLIRREFTLLLL